MEKKRIEWIDSLKGFAIICVVLGHIVKGYMDADLYINEIEFLYDIYNFIYSFHMALFFAISGFLFREAYVLGEIPNTQLKKSSINRQMINLLILYIMFSLLLGVSKMIFPGAVTNKVSVGDLLMIWAKPIQLFWYLYVLLMYYAVFRIDVIRNINPVLQIGVLSAISLISNYIPSIGLFRVIDFLYYAFFFSLGIHYKRFVGVKYEVTKIIVCIVAIVLVVVFWNREKCLFNIPVVNFVIASGLTIFFIELFRRISIAQKIFVFRVCGKYNLEIYLLHSFIVTAGRSLLVKIGLNAYLSVICNLVVSMSLIIITGIFTKRIGIYNLVFRPYYFIEKIREKSKTS